MNSVQKTLICLLEEIDRLCTSHNVTYSLADKLAYDAITEGKFVDATYEATICMPSTAYCAIKDNIPSELRANRSFIEDYNSQKKLEQVHYVANNSVLLDLYRSTKQYQTCAAVLIKVLEKNESGNYKYTSPSKKEELLPGDFFDTTQPILFEETQLQVSDKQHLMFECIYQGEWKDKKWPATIHCCSSNFFFSDIISFQELSIKAKESNIDCYKLINDFQELNSWTKKNLRPASKKVYQNDFMLLLTEHRFKMWQIYAPHKQDLMNAWNAGRKGVVKTAMRQYTSLLTSFYKESHLAICFDEDIFELALAILEESDDFTLDSNALRNAIPETHKKALVIPEGIQHDPIYKNLF